jgi:hypothetical protein
MRVLVIKAVFTHLSLGVSKQEVAALQPFGAGLSTFKTDTAQHFFVRVIDDLGDPVLVIPPGTVHVTFKPQVEHCFEEHLEALGVVTVKYLCTVTTTHSVDITIEARLSMGACCYSVSTHTARLDWYDWTGSSQSTLPLTTRVNYALAVNTDGSKLAVVSVNTVTVMRAADAAKLHTFSVQTAFGALFGTHVTVYDAVFTDSDTLILCGWQTFVALDRHLVALVIEVGIDGSRPRRLALAENVFKLAVSGPLLAAAINNSPQPHHLMLVNYRSGDVKWTTDSTKYSCWPHGPEQIVGVEFTTDGRYILVALDVHMFGTRIMAYHAEHGVISKFVHTENLSKTVDTWPDRSGFGLAVCAYNTHVVTASKNIVSVYAMKTETLSPPAKGEFHWAPVVRRWPIADMDPTEHTVAVKRGGNCLWILCFNAPYVYVIEM